MGKRSDFARRKEDAYDTPLKAVLPLLDHLEPETKFIEPCAGRGDLVTHLESYGHVCVWASDLIPRAESIDQRDALKLSIVGRGKNRIPDKAVCITNPPWTRSILHPMIFNFYWQMPTWLLFDAGWQHTEQALPYLPMLRKTVSAGRIKWIEDSEHQAKDDAQWYLFAPVEGAEPRFHGRMI